MTKTNLCNLFCFFLSLAKMLLVLILLRIGETGTVARLLPLHVLSNAPCCTFFSGVMTREGQVHNKTDKVCEYHII